MILPVQTKDISLYICVHIFSKIHVIWRKSEDTTVVVEKTFEAQKVKKTFVPKILFNNILCEDDLIYFGIFQVDLIFTDVPTASGSFAVLCWKSDASLSQLGNSKVGRITLM